MAPFSIELVPCYHSLCRRESRPEVRRPWDRHSLEPSSTIACFSHNCRRSHSRGTTTHPGELSLYYQQQWPKRTGRRVLLLSNRFLPLARTIYPAEQEGTEPILRWIVFRWPVDWFLFPGSKQFVPCRSRWHWHWIANWKSESGQTFRRSVFGCVW